MDKLTAIKIKYDDGTYSDEIPVSVFSENVEWDSTHTLADVLGSIDVDVTGTIQDQISQLFNEKVSNTQLSSYVASQLNTDVTNWLNTNVNPVGSAVTVDSSLTISGAAADAKSTGDAIVAETTAASASTAKAALIVISSDEWEIGGINATTGANGSNNYTMRTKFYHAITPYSQLQFTGVRTKDNLNRSILAYFYDINKNYISRNTTFIIPENSAFVRFTYGWISSSGQTVSNYGLENLVAEWSIKSFAEYDKEISEIVTKIDEVDSFAESFYTTNIENVTWEIGTINRTTGENANVNYQIRSDFIKTIAGNEIVFNGIITDENSINRTVSIFYYDNTKNFLLCEYISNSKSTIPTNAAFARFTYGYLSTAGVVLSDTTISTDFSVDCMPHSIAEINTRLKAMEPGAIFTFIDDDGYAEQLEHWLDVSLISGIKITECIVTGWIG